MGSCCHGSWASRTTLTPALLPFEASAGRCLTRRLTGRRAALACRNYSQHCGRHFRPGFLTVLRHISGFPPVVLNSYASQGQQRHSKLFSIGQHQRLEGRGHCQAERSTIQHDLGKLSDLDSADITPWRSAFKEMRDTHGVDGTWAVFELAKGNNKLQVLLEPEAEDLRDHIIEAASCDDGRLECITSIDHKLRILGYPRWPNFYIKVMQNLIRLSQIERTTQWHRELCKKLRPTPETITDMLLLYVTDERKWVQKTLLSLYAASPGIQIYDSIVSTLFERGQLTLARAWRKACINSRDLPLSQRSREFLRFIARYSPQTKLEREELAVLSNDSLPARPNTETTPTQEPAPHDGLVANWFASSWLPVDFAINMVYQLGAWVIGPRALQALALRESDARGVAKRIDQLERLGIRIASQPYCDVIRRFAASGRDELLSDLLRCDIHPTEFNDSAKRQMLLDDAIRRHDSGLERLLRGVEALTDTHPLPHQLNRLMEVALQKQSTLAKAFMVLDRMNATNVDISEKNGLTLLKRVFRGRTRTIPGTSIKYRNMMSKDSRDLYRALGAVRQLSFHKFPVPLWHWTELLYNLGELGRINDLERLSFDFIQLFQQQNMPLIPVFDHTSGSPNGEKQYIPAELPFSHRQHPVQEVFSAKMQRFIVDCGFRAALSKQLSPFALEEHKTEAADFGIAGGVFVLAGLRDQGVLIESALVENAVLRSIRLGQKSGDIGQISSDTVKDLVDQAWGCELLPSIDEIDQATMRKLLPPLGPLQYQADRPCHKSIWQPKLDESPERPLRTWREPDVNL